MVHYVFFSLPAPQRSPMKVLSKTERKRLTGLNARQREELEELASAHGHGDVARASANWLILSMEIPDHPEILRWAAQLHLADGDIGRAVSALQRALEQRPDDPQLLRSLGSALASQGREEEAFAALQQAASCTVESEEWLALAIAFDQQGHHAEALAAAEKTLRQSPNATRPRLMRARCLQTIGRIPAASPRWPSTPASSRSPAAPAVRLRSRWRREPTAPSP